MFVFMGSVRGAKSLECLCLCLAFAIDRYALPKPIEKRHKSTL
jgi:hypothetical protein